MQVFRQRNFIEKDRIGNMIDILKGVRVLDLGRYISAPTCCRILADMGAEVIKVERVRGGDDARSLPPFQEGDSLYFASFNRNKKSITVDFRSEKGKELLRRLIEKSDVVVENFRVGTMEAMGFGYEEVGKINPRAIMLSISGYGQDGPDALRPAFDGIISSRAHLYEEKDGGFCRGPELMSDTLSGIHSALAVVLALYDREKTGKGQWIDAPMLTSSASMQPILLANAAVNPGQNEYSVDSPNGTFRTKDGWYTIHCGPQAMFLLLAKLVNDPVLLDEKYLDVNVRVREDAVLKERLGLWFMERTNEEITALFMEHAIPGGPVSTLTDVLNDRQLRHRGDIADIPMKNGGTVPFVKFPAKFSGHEEQQDSGAPALGEDNLSVLTDVLGMTEEEANTYIG